MIYVGGGGSPVRERSLISYATYVFKFVVTHTGEYLVVCPC